jgi:hypothetical protein
MLRILRGSKLPVTGENTAPRRKYFRAAVRAFYAASRHPPNIYDPIRPPRAIASAQLPPSLRIDAQKHPPIYPRPSLRGELPCAFRTSWSLPTGLTDARQPMRPSAHSADCENIATARANRLSQLRAGHSPTPIDPDHSGLGVTIDTSPPGKNHSTCAASALKAGRAASGSAASAAGQGTRSNQAVSRS